MTLNLSQIVSVCDAPQPELTFQLAQIGLDLILFHLNFPPWHQWPSRNFSIPPGVWLTFVDLWESGDRSACDAQSPRTSCCATNPGSPVDAGQDKSSLQAGQTCPGFSFAGIRSLRTHEPGYLLKSPVITNQDAL